MLCPSNLLGFFFIKYTELWVPLVQNFFQLHVCEKHFLHPNIGLAVTSQSEEKRLIMQICMVYYWDKVYKFINKSNIHSIPCLVKSESDTKVHKIFILKK